VFGSRVAALRQLGIVDADLQSVVSRSTVFLTTKNAPHEQIAFLRDELGYSMEQVGGGETRVVLQKDVGTPRAVMNASHDVFSSAR